MKKFVLLAAGLSIAAAAPAAAQTVGVYDAFHGPAAYTSYLSGQGYTTSQLNASFTAADLIGKNLVILAALSSVSTAQTSALRDYVNGGGRLFLLSDAGVFTAQVAAFNTVSAAIGSTIVDDLRSLDGGYRTVTTIAASPFTAGVNSFEYAYSSGLTGGTTLVTGTSGQSVISYQQVGSGYFFGSSDTDIQANLGNASLGNGQLLKNFATVTATAAVPEPATWAMMIAGFGAVGFAMRRRRVAHAALARA